MNKKIYIQWDEYDRIFDEWVMVVFKRITNVDTKKFDKAIGIKYTSDGSNDINGFGYFFEVENDEKFMLAVLKFQIDFKNSVDKNPKITYNP